MAEAREHTVVDPAAMRALAHPIRWSLIEALGVEGTATATRCAEILGESQATCSFHLRQLARYGFVQEAPSDSKRERPWRLTQLEQSWSAADAEDELTGRASRALTAAFVERETGRLQNWVQNTHRAPKKWQHAWGLNGSLTWLTADELDALSQTLTDALEVHRERLTDPATRPAGSLPVRMFSVVYPLTEYPPAEGDHVSTA
ncbi:MAG: ArsR/SmtB family transcription factor [Jatrophihabitans sp.]